MGVEACWAGAGHEILCSRNEAKDFILPLILSKWKNENFYLICNVYYTDKHFWNYAVGRHGIP